VTAAERRVEAARSAVTEAQSTSTAAGEQFCIETTGYIEALDRYGKLFTDSAATVGDVETGGADLVEPRESVASAAADVDAANTALAEAEQELVDAEAALTAAIATASSLPASSTTPVTPTTTTIVSPATIERVQQAEDDLARTAEGITDATPLTEATAEYNSAAFALQIAWLGLLADAGCLTDDQHVQAVELVTAYTSTLQTVLTLTGSWTGGIDGQWTEELTSALHAFQTALGVEPTGVVDPATLAAFQQAVSELASVATATTTPTTTPTSPPTAESTSAPATTTG
jgi:murein L,D-transpeptidase YcbB/YkuD